jgi:hypothetical protein
MAYTRILSGLERLHELQKIQKMLDTLVKHVTTVHNYADNLVANRVGAKGISVTINAMLEECNNEADLIAAELSGLNWIYRDKITAFTNDGQGESIGNTLLATRDLEDLSNTGMFTALEVGDVVRLSNLTTAADDGLYQVDSFTKVEALEAQASAMSLNTMWDAGAGWVVNDGGSGVAEAVAAEEGLVLDATGLAEALSSGTYYEVTFTVVTGSFAGGSARFYLGGTLGSVIAAAGTYTEVIKCGGDGIIGFDPVIDDPFTANIDNVYVRRITHVVFSANGTADHAEESAIELTLERRDV